MANVKSITIASAGNDRKHMVRQGDQMVQGMKAAKRKGDHILITMDDGSTQQYVLGDHSIHAGEDGLTIELVPGVEQ